METQFKELRNGAPDVLDLKNAPTTGGGVGDTFGEDAATEEQTLTPWSRVVAR
jgi:malate dehydrogenase (oxaloacetate-decarboxylating)(NADP+)